MKKTAARFVVALFFACLFWLTIYVSAETTSDKQFTIANAVHLAKYLIGEETTISTEYDINLDKTINVIDLTLLKRQILYGSPVSSSETTTTTSVTTSENPTSSTTTTTVRADPIVERQIKKVSVTDTVIPPYEEDLFEVKDSVYLFNVNGTLYAYTLLSETEQTPLSIFKDKFSIVGIHFWVYEGYGTVYDVNNPLPDTTGMQFIITAPDTDQTRFDYNLVPYAELDYMTICYAADSVAGGTLQDPRNIAKYDYNLSGRIDENDIEIMIHYYTSNVMNHFFINDDMMMRYFENMTKLKHTNAVLYNHKSTDVIPFAYNIPTADLKIGSTNKAATVPVQILPVSYADELKYCHEFTDISDEDADYYAWDNISRGWAKVSSTSQNWKFRGAFVVYVLDENGKYVKEWIH